MSANVLFIHKTKQQYGCSYRDISKMSNISINGVVGLRKHFQITQNIAIKLEESEYYEALQVKLEVKNMEKRRNTKASANNDWTIQIVKRIVEAESNFLNWKSKMKQIIKPFFCVCLFNASILAEAKNGPKTVVEFNNNGDTSIVWNFDAKGLLIKKKVYKTYFYFNGEKHPHIEYEYTYKVINGTNIPISYKQFLYINVAHCYDVIQGELRNGRTVPFNHNIIEAEEYFLLDSNFHLIGEQMFRYDNEKDGRGVTIYCCDSNCLQNGLQKEIPRHPYLRRLDIPDQRCIGKIHNTHYGHPDKIDADTIMLGPFDAPRISYGIHLTKSCNSKNNFPLDSILESNCQFYFDSFDSHKIYIKSERFGFFGPYNTREKYCYKNYELTLSPSKAEISNTGFYFGYKYKFYVEQVSIKELISYNRRNKIKFKVVRKTK